MNNCSMFQAAGRFYTDDPDACVPVGSVIFPKRGAAIENNKVRIAKVVLAIDTNLMALVPLRSVDTGFLYYFVTFQGLHRIADTSTIPQLNNKHIVPYPIDLPPLPEQRKIAAILRTWDEAIEKLEALRATYEQRRVWLRINVIGGRVRRGGFRKEWREVRLGQVLVEHGIKSSGIEEVFSVSVHKGLVNQIEHLGRSFAAADTANYNRVLPGDIVYTKSPTGEFPLGIIKQSSIDREVIVSPLYGVFSPETRNLGVILDALFESPVLTRNYLRPLVQKGAKNTIAITNRRFLEGKLLLPSDPAEQDSIAALLETARAEIRRIEAEIVALNRQKRGLMQKLLTGEWRTEL